jgi:hypothetical protein
MPTRFAFMNEKLRKNQENQERLKPSTRFADAWKSAEQMPHSEENAGVEDLP